MADRKKTMKVQTFLKSHTQKELADIFCRTQGWVSKIVAQAPDARLIYVDGEITEMEYTVQKRTRRTV